MAVLHGGSVAVVSTLGQGSRFTIILPWAATLPDTASCPASDDHPHPNKRTLCASACSWSHASAADVDEPRVSVERYADYAEARTARRLAMTCRNARSII